MTRNDFNKVILTGYIDSRPRLCYTSDRTPVINFILNSQLKNRVDSFDITVWGDLAKQVVDFIDIDDKILIEGFMQHRALKKDGYEPGNIIEIVGKRIFSLSHNIELTYSNGVSN